MQQHLQRQDGVEKVDVNLLDGKVVIFSRNDVLLRPEVIVKATYDSGVSISEVTITAVGWIEHRASGVIFRTGGNQEFSMISNGASESLSEETMLSRIRVKGRLVEHETNDDIRMKLEILEIWEVP